MHIFFVATSMYLNDNKWRPAGVALFNFFLVIYRNVYFVQQQQKNGDVKLTFFNFLSAQNKTQIVNTV